MKKITILLVLLITTASFSQGLYAELGKVDSSFEFTNSDGEMLENLQHTTQNYVEAGYQRRIFTDGLNIGLGLSYNSYGATGSDESQNNYFEWDVDYLGIVLSLDYAVFNIDKLAFHLKATSSVEFLVQGTQKINNQVINLINVEEFDNKAIFFRGGAGLSYPLSDTVGLYAQYLYGQSLPMKDNRNASSNEELTIITHMIGIGIRIKLPEKQAVEMEEETEETED